MMKRKKFGFTVAELMITIAIIGITAAIAIPIFYSESQKAQRAAILATQVQNIENAFAKMMVVEGKTSLSDTRFGIALSAQAERSLELNENTTGAEREAYSNDVDQAMEILREYLHTNASDTSVTQTSFNIDSKMMVELANSFIGINPAYAADPDRIRTNNCAGKPVVYNINGSEVSCCYAFKMYNPWEKLDDIFPLCHALQCPSKSLLCHQHKRCEPLKHNCPNGYWDNNDHECVTCPSDKRYCEEHGCEPSYCPTNNYAGRHPDTHECIYCNPTNQRFCPNCGGCIPKNLRCNNRQKWCDENCHHRCETNCGLVGAVLNSTHTACVCPNEGDVICPEHGCENQNCSNPYTEWDDDLQKCAKNDDNCGPNGEPDNNGGCSCNSGSTWCEKHQICEDQNCPDGLFGSEEWNDDDSDRGKTGCRPKECGVCPRGSNGQCEINTENQSNSAYVFCPEHCRYCPTQAACGEGEHVENRTGGHTCVGNCTNGGTWCSVHHQCERPCPPNYHRDGDHECVAGNTQNLDEYKALSGEDLNDISFQTKITTKNNTTFMFAANASSGVEDYQGNVDKRIKKFGVLYIDVNGMNNKPNKAGDDLFAFVITNDGHLIPFGSTELGRSMGDYHTSCTTNVRRRDNVSESGLGCTAKLVENKYKINY